ncbi:hypothetical protein LTR37_019125 [Vermiconidia calcicola]|uniref:Uncharacterized protein n=1 Tax=Vermiconidia calcicola TaxID=1690605 RepID=A0ACC3MGV3_9PEZI|nr:hypothetical protein LTR37_019125 [Vermiconidia calcicola]
MERTRNLKTMLPQRNPFERLAISWDERHKLNLEHRNLPYGELEAGRQRRKRARKITWLVDYAREEGNEEFTMPNEADGHEFSSMEQWYQYCKAKCIASASERFTDIHSQILSSRDLPAYILTLDNPNRSAEAGRSFNNIMDRDSHWADEWVPIWDQLKPRALAKGVQAKFEQNEDIAELLMMTGVFNLVKASKRDRSCGIGFHASLAEEKRRAGQWGENLLGKALENTRGAMFEQYRVAEPEYAFDFWRLWEETCNNERYRKLMARRNVLNPADVPPGDPKFDDTRNRGHLNAEMEVHKEAWKETHIGSADEGYTSDRSSESPEAEE